MFIYYLIVSIAVTSIGILFYIRPKRFLNMLAFIFMFRRYIRGQFMGGFSVKKDFINENPSDLALFFSRLVSFIIIIMGIGILLLYPLQNA